MPIVTENFHEKRLKKLDVHIKTLYQDGHEKVERDSNTANNSDIKGGIILNKAYYKNENLKLVEKNFNPRVIYSYIVKDELSKTVKCPNCGHQDKTEKFLDGCPYCKTFYNVDYSEKALGNKYHYDQIMQDNKYIIYTFLIDLICCLSISTIYFTTTGRTFTIFDVLKILGFGFLGTLLLFYVFYYLDALIVTIPVKMIKEKQNKRQQKFWEEMEKKNISKQSFFNNFNYELNEYYYDDKIETNKNVIDFDILEYNEYKDFLDDKSRLNVKVSVKIREVRVEGENLNTKTINKEFVLIKNEIEQNKLDAGVNIIKCHNCGASIDVTKNECPYCKTKINYLQDWYIVR